MTYARVYQCGMKAFVAGVPLAGNPYKGADCDAWSDGWHDASHARWRIHAHKNAEHILPHRSAKESGVELPSDLLSRSKAPGESN